jgi:hypothetical protein
MWYFRKKGPAEKIRNPIQGEFFSAEAIDGPSEALVRESIQNSLDAQASDQVHVRIALHSGEGALPGSAVEALFGAAWSHYHAKANGLHAPPARGSDCAFLVVEDFGTKGLTGDPTQGDPDPDPNVKNPFCLFFRAEGLSAKTGVELGRWGVGKFVFARSSMASTHFGLTVRSDDGRRLLLGSVTLKAHYIDGEKSLFSPDGMYGRSADKESDFVLPIDDPARIDEICRLFRITRTRETGLSVVVPFVDPEITYERLLLAAAKDYFLPILGGRLTVEVVAGDRSARLTSDTLVDVVQKNAIGSGVPELISLAKFSLTAKSEDRVQIGMPDPKRAAAWSEELVSDAVFEKLQERIDAGAPVAVRCPVTVRSKREGDVTSHFDLYLMRDKHCEGRPVFLREGIVISDVRGRRAREVRSIVVIEDKPLAAMLGDSENPAHTQWQKDGSNFKGKYTYGPGVIQYVADSVGELVAILSRRNAEADASLTVDYFSIEPPDELEETEPSEVREPKPKYGPETPKDKLKIPARPSRIVIQREPGGFAVKPGSAPMPPPYLLEVRCAYDIRAGNPIRKWSSADFMLGSSAVPLTCTGSAKVVEARGNAAVILIEGPDFGVSAKGFDADRDIYVRADVREARDADQEA